MQCGIFQTDQKNIIWYITTKVSDIFQPEPQQISDQTNKSQLVLKYNSKRYISAWTKKPGRIKQYKRNRHILDWTEKSQLVQSCTKRIQRAYFYVMHRNTSTSTKLQKQAAHFSPNRSVFHTRQMNLNQYLATNTSGTFQHGPNTEL